MHSGALCPMSRGGTNALVLCVGVFARAPRGVLREHRPAATLCVTQRAVSPSVAHEPNRVCICAQSALRLQQLVTTLPCSRFLACARSNIVQLGSCTVPHSLRCCCLICARFGLASATVLTLRLRHTHLVRVEGAAFESRPARFHGVAYGLSAVCCYLAAAYPWRGAGRAAAPVTRRMPGGKWTACTRTVANGRSTTPPRCAPVVLRSTLAAPCQIFNSCSRGAGAPVLTSCGGCRRTSNSSGGRCRRRWCRPRDRPRARPCGQSTATRHGVVG